MKRISTLSLFILALVLSIATPATAQDCKEDIVASGKASLTKIPGAYLSSLWAWRRATKAAYGADYQPWRRAKRRNISCVKGSKNGRSGWVCTRSASPCSLKGLGPTSSLGAGSIAAENSYELPSTTMRPGDQSDNVRVLQQILQDIGYDVQVDGNYFGGTTRAVIKFQKSEGLNADGVVGPQTRARLLEAATPSTVAKIGDKIKSGFGKIFSKGSKITQTLRRGDTGEQVKMLQEHLRKAGFDVKVDGNFGRGTMAAVEQFQKKNGLSADGVVGAKTRAVL